jgi:hypothetical protein
MHYKSEKLEATHDVRSVPLGEKRRKGRPKKIPNCLVKSPIRVPMSSNDVGLEEFEVPSVEPDDLIDVGVRATSRKRKRVEQQSPVHALMSQMLKPGLGRSKPPKKRVRMNVNSSAEVSKPSNASTVEKVSDDPNDDKVSKPNPVKCKKKTGSCSHEIVFGEHYGKVAWYRYAEHVRKKKSTIEVDPEYVP